MENVKVILLEDGKKTRELNYPFANAEKLLRTNSGWVLPQNSPYDFIDRRLVKKPKETKKDTVL